MPSNFHRVFSRPGLYMGGSTVEHLAHYVRGYLHGVRDFSPEAVTEHALMDDFEAWLCRKLEVPRQPWHKALMGKWREPARALAVLQEGFADFVRQAGREVTEYLFDRPEASARLADLANQRSFRLLRRMREDPYALLDRPAIDLLLSFHVGYDMGWGDACGVNPFGPAPSYTLGEFTAWFNGHYNGADSATFCYRIRERSRSDEEAFDLFWHYFDEFLVHRALDPSEATVPPLGPETFFSLWESLTLGCELSVERSADTTVIRVIAPRPELPQWAEALARLRRGFGVELKLLGGDRPVILANHGDRSPPCAYEHSGEWTLTLNAWNVERVHEFFLRHQHDAPWKPSSVAILFPPKSPQWPERHNSAASAVLLLQHGE